MSQSDEEESLPTMAFKNSSCIEVPEYVFRHTALSSLNLDGLIDLKNNKYEDGNNVPHTLGVYPADVHLNITSDFLFFETNWIVNTDTSEKAGTHWQCVLYKQSLIKSHDEGELCKYVKYYIIDSWGMKHVEMITRNVINTITEYREENDKVHRQCLRSINVKKCSCQFEINFPITHHIQHSNFENCGWFALYFARFGDDLMQWVKTKKGQYGQIKSNYDDITNYFKYNFFKNINVCKMFHKFKIKT